MATRRNDPTLPEQIRRMLGAGLSRPAIAHHLKLHLTTVRWHLRTTPEPQRCARYYDRVMDNLGERASLPPGKVLYRCICGGLSERPAGHPRCRTAA